MTKSGFWGQPEVLEAYSHERPLYRAEEYLIGKFFRPGMHVLDIGCGTGRVTARLVKQAGLVKGVDIDPNMLEIFQKRFPSAVAGCCPMEELEETPEIYDLILIPYNSLDCVDTKEKRMEVLKRLHRFLKPGGVLIFSSHNPYGDFGGWVYSWRPVTLRSIFERIAKGYSFKSECFVPERQFNSIVPYYYGNDDRIVNDVESLGFGLLEKCGARFGSTNPLFFRWFEFWIYYAFRKL